MPWTSSSGAGARSTRDPPDCPKAATPRLSKWSPPADAQRMLGGNGRGDLAGVVVGQELRPLGSRLRIGLDEILCLQAGSGLGDVARAPLVDRRKGRDASWRQYRVERRGLIAVGGVEPRGGHEQVVL